MVDKATDRNPMVKFMLERMQEVRRVFQPANQRCLLPPPLPLPAGRPTEAPTVSLFFPSPTHTSGRFGACRRAAW